MNRRPSSLWLVVPFVAFGVGVLIWRNAWAALLFYHALLLMPLWIHREKWHLRQLIRGFRWPVIAFHTALVVAGYFLLTALGTARGFSGQRLETLVEMFGSAGPGFALYFIFVNPVFEEIFWRGLFAREDAGLTLEDVAFGTFHAVILYPFFSAPYIVTGVLLLIAVAWIWRRLRWRTSGLAIPWYGHTTGDAMLVLIVATLIARP